MPDPKVVAVIPSRFGSTRLPGKPLVTLGGKPMVQHVYERAKRCKPYTRCWWLRTTNGFLMRCAPLEARRG